jgi:signal transduction histidine kinase
MQNFRYLICFTKYIKAIIWIVALFIILEVKAQTQVSDNIIDTFRKNIHSLEKQKNGYVKDTSLAVAYASIARIFVDESADSLMYYQRKAEKLAQKTQYPKAIGLVEVCKGVYYREQGYYDEAIKSFNNALLIWNNNDVSEKAHTYIGMGTVYTYANQYDKAIEYHKKSLALFRSINDLTGIVDNLANIGNAYLENGFPAKALPYFKSLEKRYRSLQQKDIEDIAGHKCVNYINLCTTYLRLNDYVNAISYEDSVFYYCRITNGIAEKQYILTEFSEYFIRVGKLTEALQTLRTSDTLTDLLMSEEKKAKTQYLKYKIFKGLTMADSALYYYEKYSQLNEKFKKEEALEEIRFEVDAKTKKIEELNFNSQRQKQLGLSVLSMILIISLIYFYFINQKLRKKNKAITEALLRGQTIERKRVAADLHDTLGSTMSSLIWTLDSINTKKLHQQELEIFETLKKMLTNAYDEIRLLAHNLLPEELEQKGLVSALRYFVRKINQNSTIKFELESKGEFNNMDKKMEFELYSICLELVNNIIKHSKASRASVLLLKDSKQIILKIEDNGIGITQTNSEGRGLKNVKNRAESLGGSLKFLGISPHGTLSEIRIPITK